MNINKVISVSAVACIVGAVIALVVTEVEG